MGRPGGKAPRTERLHVRIALVAKRRAAKLQATPPWLTAGHIAAMQAKFEEAARLTADTGIEHHVDHIVPLQGRGVRGLHVPWNLQVIPASVNLKKHNRLVDA